MQCLSALDVVSVAGEQNQIQLIGVRRSLREIINEANKNETTKIEMDTDALKKAVTE
jgi:hypothetical protein